VDADGLVAMDDLPLGIFGAAAGDLAGDSAGQDGARAATNIEACLSSIVYDAVPTLSTAGDPQAEEEVAAVCRASALVDLLQVSSQLARNSERHYGMLSSVFTAEKLVWILKLTDPTARAKCCNLVGNLCR
jgi:hypothetical protein